MIHWLFFYLYHGFWLATTPTALKNKEKKKLPKKAIEIYSLIEISILSLVAAQEMAKEMLANLLKRKTI